MVFSREAPGSRRPDNVSTRKVPIIRNTKSRRGLWCDASNSAVSPRATRASSREPERSARAISERCYVSWRARVRARRPVGCTRVPRALRRSGLACAGGVALLDHRGLDAAGLAGRTDGACVGARLVRTGLVSAAHGPGDAIAAAIADLNLGAGLAVPVRHAQRAWLATTLSATVVDRSAGSRTTTTRRPENQHPHEERGQPDAYREHGASYRAPDMPRVRPPRDRCMAAFVTERALLACELGGRCGAGPGRRAGSTS